MGGLSPVSLSVRVPSLPVRPHLLYYFYSSSQTCPSLSLLICYYSSCLTLVMREHVGLDVHICPSDKSDISLWKLYNDCVQGNRLV